MKNTLFVLAVLFCLSLSLGTTSSATPGYSVYTTYAAGDTTCSSVEVNYEVQAVADISTCHNEACGVESDNSTHYSMFYFFIFFVHNHHFIFVLSF
jgi:hypothetical protein